VAPRLDLQARALVFGGSAVLLPKPASHEIIDGVRETLGRSGLSEAWRSTALLEPFPTSLTPASARKAGRHRE
jgi:hypothetical protein